MLKKGVEGKEKSLCSVCGEKVKVVANVRWHELVCDAIVSWPPTATVTPVPPGVAAAAQGAVTPAMTQADVRTEIHLHLQSLCLSMLGEFCKVSDCVMCNELSVCIVGSQVQSLLPFLATCVCVCMCVHV